jgi:hypothetical protein
MRKGIITIGNDHFTSIPAGWNAQTAVIAQGRAEGIKSTVSGSSSPETE